MSKTYTIQFEEQEFEFPCDDDDTLLRAALRAGLGFPYECNSGGCGTCKFELHSGQVDNRWPDAPGLSSRDRRKGRQLACQCVPKSDCVIQARLLHDKVPQLRPNRLPAELVSVRELTSDMAEFRFKTEHPAHFLPGQFALLDVPEVEGSRGYSMSNLPNEDGVWEFIIKKMPDGTASTKLFEACRIGDQLMLDGPYGLSFLRPEVPRDLVCIAGGSGLSPILSIVRAASHDKRLAKRDIQLFYGGRTPADLCVQPYLDADPAMAERVQLHQAISEPDAAESADWDGPTGFVHDLVFSTLSEPLDNYEYYFCGPPVMIDTVSRLLLVEHRVPFDQVHYDRFY